MNRAALLKRIEALEAAISVTPVHPLRFMEGAAMPDADRDRFWSGDTSVIDEYRDPNSRTIIVDLNPASRASWLETRDMTEEQRESHESELDRQEAAERAASMRKARPVVTPESETSPPAVWGWAADGTPIFVDDPRFLDGIGAAIERQN